jgi:hypothetical protein
MALLVCNGAIVSVFSHLLHFLLVHTESLNATFKKVKSRMTVYGVMTFLLNSISTMYASHWQAALVLVL